MKNVLLITGCIEPNKEAIFLEVSNPDIRLNQYIETINWALNESDFDTVVFCENSNYRYDFNFLNEKNKFFEYLTFEGDFLKSNKYGKGYGEGEIVKYALDNSKYLKNTTYFYKLTGRLKVKNINKILHLSKDKNYFLNFLFSNSSIDTRFYKINTKLYMEKFLYACDSVRDKEGKTLERVFYHIMSENKLKHYCFRRYPIISGISGSTGVVYNTVGIKIYIYDFLCRMNLYNAKIISKIILKIINKK